jgi:hypothetical protein
VARDSAVVRIRDAEDRETLAEREARERVSRVEVENAAELAFAREDASGFVQRVALLKGELAEACCAREVAEENFRDLSDIANDGARRLVVFEREHQEQFDELILLQT